MNRAPYRKFCIGALQKLMFRYLTAFKIVTVHNGKQMHFKKQQQVYNIIASWTLIDKTLEACVLWLQMLIK